MHQCKVIREASSYLLWRGKKKKKTGMITEQKREEKRTNQAKTTAHSVCEKKRILIQPLTWTISFLIKYFSCWHIFLFASCVSVCLPFSLLHLFLKLIIWCVFLLSPLANRCFITEKLFCFSLLFYGNLRLFCFSTSSAFTLTSHQVVQLVKVGLLQSIEFSFRWPFNWDVLGC